MCDGWIPGLWRLPSLHAIARARLCATAHNQIDELVDHHMPSENVHGARRSNQAGQVSSGQQQATLVVVFAVATRESAHTHCEL